MSLPSIYHRPYKKPASREAITFIDQYRDRRAFVTGLIFRAAITMTLVAMIGSTVPHSASRVNAVMPAVSIVD